MGRREPRGDSDIATLFETVHDRSLRTFVRNRALELLVRAELERVWDLAPAALHDLELDDEVVIAALRRQSGRPSAVRAAMRLVQDLSGSTIGSSSSVALAVLEALTDPRLEDQPWLQRTLWSHPDRQVQWLAAERLVATADAAKLLEIVQDARELDRLVAIQPLLIDRALDMIGDRATTDATRRRIIARLRDFFGSPRELASPLALSIVRALIREAAPEGLAALLALADHPDAQVTTEAVVGIVALPVEPSTILDAARPTTRNLLLTVAPQGARELGARVLALVRALHDDVRPDQTALCMKYVAVLGEMGDGRDSEALARHLASDDEGLVLATLDALAAVGDFRALGAIKPLTSGWLRDRVIKDRARAAIDTITERVGDRAGALTLDDRAGGGLSLDD